MYIYTVSETEYKYIFPLEVPTANTSPSGHIATTHDASFTCNNPYMYICAYIYIYIYSYACIYIFIDMCTNIYILA